MMDMPAPLNGQANGHVNGQPTLADQVADLNSRVAALEELVEAARNRQQQAAAAALAANPAQMQALQALLDMAKATPATPKSTAAQ